MVKIPFFYQVLCIHGGCLGFLNHQQYHPKTNPRSLDSKLPGAYQNPWKVAFTRKKIARPFLPQCDLQDFYSMKHLGYGWTTYQSNYNSPKRDMKAPKKRLVFAMFFVLHVEGIFLRKHQQFITKHCLGLLRLAETVEQRKKTVLDFHWILVVS